MNTIAIATEFLRAVAELLARLGPDPLDPERLLRHGRGAQLGAEAVHELVPLRLRAGSPRGGRAGW